MLIKTFGSAVYGIDAQTITIEVNATKGYQYHLVGLPDNAVKESQQRIEAALTNIGLRMPGMKLVINMAPADIRKEGSYYDLPIALGILAASGQLNSHLLEDYVIMGELSLDGGLQPMKGTLPIAIQAKKEGFKGLIIPEQNVEEAAIVEGLDVYGVSELKEVVDFLNDETTLTPTRINLKKAFEPKRDRYTLDFQDVKGNEAAKRALEIAAAGGHNLLMIGPPGVGKTMLAKRIPTILPPLTMEEALETTKIHSVAGKLGTRTSLLTSRPFRSPHHSISGAALVGGGSNPLPGEISLSHNGVLFLDELPEFQRSVLEVMRQPLEDRIVTISRAKLSVDYPASFMLVASMNPSPSGNFYDPNDPNSDPEYAVRRYLNKISGPLLDRIDLHIEVNPVPFEKLSNTEKTESSSEIRARVVKARIIQQKRFNGVKGVFNNSQITPKLQETYCRLDDAGEALLKKAMDKLGFSARSYTRILKVARTIADLSEAENIQPPHVAESIQYRSLDREGWLA